MSLFNALKLGMRSLGDDAYRAATIRNAVQQNVDDLAKSAVKTMSADDAAAAIAKYSQDADDYLANFNAAYKAPQLDGAEGVAYGVGRGLAGVGQKVNNVVAPLGGIPGVAMQAAFMAPMFMSMGGGEQPQPEPQPNPYEQEAMLRARARHMRMQQQQEAQQWGG